MSSLPVNSAPNTSRRSPAPSNQRRAPAPGLCAAWLLNGLCKRNNCQYRHDAKHLISNIDAKRKTVLCEYWLAGTCSKPDCAFAHSLSELHLPSNFVSKNRGLCTDWLYNGQCYNKTEDPTDVCRAAHGLKKIILKEGSALSERFCLSWFSTNQCGSQNCEFSHSLIVFPEVQGSSPVVGNRKTDGNVDPGVQLRRSPPPPPADVNRFGVKTEKNLTKMVHEDAATMYRAMNVQLAQMIRGYSRLLTGPAQEACQQLAVTHDMIAAGRDQAGLVIGRTAENILCAMCKGLSIPYTRTTLGDLRPGIERSLKTEEVARFSGYIRAISQTRAHGAHAGLYVTEESLHMGLEGLVDLIEFYFTFEEHLKP